MKDQSKIDRTGMSRAIRLWAGFLAIAAGVACSAGDNLSDETGNPVASAGGAMGIAAGGFGGSYVPGAGGAAGQVVMPGAGGTAVVGAGGSVVSQGGQGGGPPASGDWCSVKQILETSCHRCHGAEPAFGAPMSLVTHADLMASAQDGRPLYEVALERVTAEKAFMPPIPNPRLDADAVASLEDWVNAGAPDNPSCGAIVGAGGGGGIGGAGGSGGGPTECIDCGDYKCENGTPIRFLAHGQQTPGDTTPYDASQIGGAATFGDPNLYQCFYFKAPWGAGAQSTGHRPVIDNTRIMHHWLLYASDNAPLDLQDGMMRGDCQLQSDANRILLAGWAAGTPGMNFPPDVGQELPTGPNAYVTLEIHYFNTQPGDPAPDNSGVEICMADTPRPNTSTMHWLGTENINLPPGVEATAGDTCTPPLAVGQTSTILNVTPHMHYLGTHSKLEILRANGQVETILDKPFAFDNQTTYVIDPPAVVNAGDRVRATCTFQNDTAAPVAFGEGSQEEMCYLFTSAYPSGSLANGKTGCFLGLCVPGGVRRCIDNENILTAIGGL